MPVGTGADQPEPLGLHHGIPAGLLRHQHRHGPVPAADGGAAAERGAVEPLGGGVHRGLRRHAAGLPHSRQAVGQALLQVGPPSALRRRGLSAGAPRLCGHVVRECVDLAGALPRLPPAGGARPERGLLGAVRPPGRPPGRRRRRGRGGRPDRQRQRHSGHPLLPGVPVGHGRAGPDSPPSPACAVPAVHAGCGRHLCRRVQLCAGGPAAGGRGSRAAHAGRTAAGLPAGPEAGLRLLLGLRGEDVLLRHDLCGRVQLLLPPRHAAHLGGGGPETPARHHGGPGPGGRLRLQLPAGPALRPHRPEARDLRGLRDHGGHLRRVHRRPHGGRARVVASGPGRRAVLRRGQRRVPERGLRAGAGLPAQGQDGGRGLRPLGRRGLCGLCRGPTGGRLPALRRPSAQRPGGRGLQLHGLRARHVLPGLRHEWCLSTFHWEDCRGEVTWEHPFSGCHDASSVVLQRDSCTSQRLASMKNLLCV
mmetsp:Transcript_39346/g.117722  ORF Transcript_39346/g.117722 Transcript_39346/m.117722 type:complete len:477 (-) Transcript_39346:442-1872(-)